MRGNRFYGITVALVEGLIISMLIAGIAFSAEGSGSPTPSEQPSAGAPESAVSGGTTDYVVVTVPLESKIPPELSTPRLCYTSYRQSMARAIRGETGALRKAAECLDLSEVNPLIRKEMGEELAVRLAKILDFSTPLDEDSIPNLSTGTPVVLLERPDGAIVIGLSEDGGWRFTGETVSAVPEIYRTMDANGEFDAIRLGMPRGGGILGGRTSTGIDFRSIVPARFKKQTFLIEDWQWLFLLILMLLGLILGRLVSWLVEWIFSLSLRRVLGEKRRKLLISASLPFGFFAAAVLLWVGLGKSGLNESVLLVLLGAAKLVTTAGIVWAAYRAVDIFGAWMEQRATVTDSRNSEVLVPFVRKTLKVVVTLLGIVFIAGIMGINVTGLVAGLGLGGIAIALAAKDPLENLFGSIVVLLDRPFRVGDWVRIGEVEGTVEDVGFRSTRIRTFQNSLVTVPNAELMRASIDNMGAREYRRVNTTIPLEYSTSPDKIEAFCEGVRTLISKHPYTRKDNYHVWLNQLGATSLDVLLYYFLETPDWATEMRERHRLFIDMIRLANELGVRFALPVQRVYMEQVWPAKSAFPEKGTIFEQDMEGRKRARELAENIAKSGLSGDGKIPPPVEFPGSDTPTEDLLL